VTLREVEVVDEGFEPVAVAAEFDAWADGQFEGVKCLAVVVGVR
jgi:hypothetical protein